MKKDNINIPLFDYSTKMLIEILDKSNINEKEKEYRKKELQDIYDKMLNDNVIYNKYYDIAHEIKSLEFLSKYPNMLISDDHLHKSGCDFKICNNYNIECVSSSSGIKSAGRHVMISASSPITFFCTSGLTGFAVFPYFPARTSFVSFVAIL